MRRLVMMVVLVMAGCGGDSTGPSEPPPAVANVSVSLSVDTILVGEAAQASAVLTDASGSTLSGRTVAWSVSPSSAASVSGSGLVTAIAPGEVTVTATSEGRQGTAELLVRSQPRTWTIEPRPGQRTSAAFVEADDSFATLFVFCDNTTSRVVWGLNFRYLGPVPFSSGVTLALLPERADDPSWSLRASSSWGGSLIMSVGTVDEPDTGGALQAMLRDREEAVLTYPTGNPVQAVTVRFDLRDAARALSEAESHCVTD